MSNASLIMFTIDCAEPRRLARFYSDLLGWEITHNQDEAAMVTDGHTSIGFGRIDGWTPPSWPDTNGAKRYHLDLAVDDLDAAEKQCHQLGASTPEFQPDGDRWRVLADPDGNLFCICLTS